MNIRKNTMEDSIASGSASQITDSDKGSVVPEGDVRAAAAELQALLETTPKDRPQDWQALISPLISKLAADFLTQNSEELALREASLVVWAAGEGSQTARKKQLKLVRWMVTMPPGLPAEFTSEAGQLAVIRTLAGVGKIWAPAYICRVWPAVTTDKVKTEVVTWLLKNSPSAVSVFQELTREAVALSPDAAVDLVARIAKQAAKTSWAFQVPRERETLGALAALYRAMADRTASGESESTDLLKQSILELTDLCVRANPPLVLGAPVVSLLDEVAPVAEKKNGRPARAALHAIARVAQSQAEFARDVLEMPETFYEASTRTASVLAKHMKRGDWPSLEPLSGHTPPDLTSQVVALLVTWDDIAANSDGAGDFGAALGQFARGLSVERLEQQGELRAFRDDMHQLVRNEDDAAPVPNKVKVLRHGYLRRRADGSFIVLMKALVERTEDV